MRKSIMTFNNKYQKHGYWEVYWFNGNLNFKGFYHNGKLVGYGEFNWYTGKLKEKKYYI